jgi:hypothetical protein
MTIKKCVNKLVHITGSVKTHVALSDQIFTSFELLPDIPTYCLQEV